MKYVLILWLACLICLYFVATAVEQSIEEQLELQNRRIEKKSKDFR